MPFDIKRRKTKAINIGSVKIGDDAPISVQSMTNTPTEDVETTLGQIERLEKAGCEIIRLAVPDMDAAKALKKIKNKAKAPLVADIHFDYRLALAAAESGVDALRINPGNIGAKKKVMAVVDAAKTHMIPIRIGVNSGSLPKDIKKKYGGPTPEAMVESAIREIAVLEGFGFTDIKISLKSSDVFTTIAAYRLMSEKTDYPLHVGVTEAGGLYSGIVKSSLGIGTILMNGIGDTIRVSLTRDPVEEVRVGFEILRTLGLRNRGPEIISCPTCGRCRINLFEIAEDVEKALLEKTTPMKIAIMGCAVNGPGEAAEADIGIAGGDGKGILFAKGKVVKTVDQDKLVETLLDAINDFEKNNGS